jgi:GNAT superfamily N-acetyltransferase
MRTTGRSAPCWSSTRAADRRFGGPWVAQLFRDPDPALAGLGRALLQCALSRATAAGLPALSLAVSEGNTAVRLYEALGFERVLSTFSIDL